MADKIEEETIVLENKNYLVCIGDQYKLYSPEGILLEKGSLGILTALLISMLKIQLK